MSRPDLLHVLGHGLLFVSRTHARTHTPLKLLSIGTTGAAAGDMGHISHLVHRVCVQVWRDISHQHQEPAWADFSVFLVYPRIRFVG